MNDRALFLTFTVVAFVSRDGSRLLRLRGIGRGTKPRTPRKDLRS